MYDSSGAMIANDIGTASTAPQIVNRAVFAPIPTELPSLQPFSVGCE
jgi:hypothetical protein